MIFLISAILEFFPERRPDIFGAIADLHFGDFTASILHAILD